MSAQRRSPGCVLAISILLGSTACRDTTRPEAAWIASSDSALAARKAQPPATANGKLQLIGNTSWSVSLSWDLTTSFGYRIRDNWGREISLPGSQTSVTWKYPAHPPLQNGATYSFTAYAVDAAGNKSASTNTVTVTLPLDTEPPTVPTFTVTSLGTRHITLAWSSTDDSPFISYKVTRDGVQAHTGWISETSMTFTLLQPGTSYTFTAQAKDTYVNVSGGNVSAVSPPFSVTTKPNDGSDVTPPTQPSPVDAFPNGGGTEILVSWAASTDNVTPGNVILYEVYVNGVHENSAIGKTSTHAYGVFGDNEVTVIAIDEAGNRSVAGRTTVFIS